MTVKPLKYCSFLTTKAELIVIKPRPPQLPDPGSTLTNQAVHNYSKFKNKPVQGEVKKLLFKHVSGVLICAEIGKKVFTKLSTKNCSGLKVHGEVGVYGSKL